MNWNHRYHAVSLESMGILAQRGRVIATSNRLATVIAAAEQYSRLHRMTVEVTDTESPHSPCASVVVRRIQAW